MVGVWGAEDPGLCATEDVFAWARRGGGWRLVGWLVSRLGGRWWGLRGGLLMVRGVRWWLLVLLLVLVSCGRWLRRLRLVMLRVLRRWGSMGLWWPRSGRRLGCCGIVSGRGARSWWRRGRLWSWHLLGWMRLFGAVRNSGWMLRRSSCVGLVLRGGS